MTIRYTCDGCGSVLNIKDEKAGTQGKCPKCKAEFLVPNPDPDVPVAAAGEGSGNSGPDSSHELFTDLPEKGSDDFSDDEIEKILESSSAPARPKNDYGVAAGDDDDDDDDDDNKVSDFPADDEDAPLELSAKRRKPVDFDDDDDDDDEDDRASRRPGKGKSPQRGKGTRPPAESVAGVAKGLMAKGEKGTREERKGGRPFGAGGEHEGDEGEEGFSLKEKAGYFARFGIPAAIGLLIAVGYFAWYMRGWQRGDLPQLAPVTGVVKLDGAPLAKAEIQFIPQQIDPNKPNLRISSSGAITNDNGEFSLIYTSFAEGAVLGKHRVQILCYSKEGQQVVPVRYNTRSELIKEVVAGSNKFEFDLQTGGENNPGSVGGFNPNP
jgi:hypothetical protein